MPTIASYSYFKNFNLTLFIPQVMQIKLLRKKYFKISI